MIPSIFLLSVAAGILIGTIIVSFGSIGAVLAGFAGLGVVTMSVAFILLSRRSPS